MTMAEYIEREAAVKVAEKYGLANGSALGRHTGLADCIASEIADIPAADVAPVVHGRWIEDHDYLKCPECGIMVKRDFTFFDIGDWNFCPNCGKKWIWRKKNETD